MRQRPATFCACLATLPVLWGCPPTQVEPPPTTPTSVCGNDRQQGREVCDGTDLDNMTCGQLGFGPGTLGCKPNCKDFDRAGCVAPSTCGNGQVERVEICDGAELGGRICEDLGRGPGTLGCLPNCGDFDTSGCGPPPDCGDDDINGSAEICDGTDLGGLSCTRLGFASGELRCAADCLALDRSGCVAADAGASDLAMLDHTGPDSSARDLGPRDLVVADAHQVDSQLHDTGHADAGAPDSSVVDGATPDTALLCTPSQPYCVSTYTRGTCNAQGTGPSSTQNCDSVAGQMCIPSTGQCLSACQAVAGTPSSYGCDFRFAITDNSLSDDLAAGSDAFPAAVVVTSVSEAGARITLRNAAGALVVASGPLHLLDRNFSSSIPAIDISSTQVGSGATSVLDGLAVDQLLLDPGDVATILLPADAILGSGVSPASFHLSSTQPVAAQLFNPICCNFAYTNDASLLLPTTAWRQSYYVLSTAHRTWSAGLLGMEQNQSLASPAGIAVVAAENSTQVAIRLRSGQAASDFAIAGGLPAFGTDTRYPDQLRITLQAGQVLQLETAFNTAGPDPTGLLVAASKPIGVFGAHQCAYVPEQSEACDHLEEMLPPIETWGTTYLAVMPRMRNTNLGSSANQERMYYRLISASDGNRVSVDPLPADLRGAQAASATSCAFDVNGGVVLNDGQFCELGSRSSFRIQAQRPIGVSALFVGQVATGLTEYGTHGGDPALSVLIPTEQWRAWYTVLAPEHYYDKLLTVIYGGNTLLYLDGVAIAPQTAGAVGSSELVETQRAVGTTGYFVLTLRLSSGSHRIWSRPASAPGTGELDVLDPGPLFSVMSYGYDDFVSYAMPGGSNLAPRTSYTNLPAFD
ncbi:MAG: IgGFc-binding protein [Pseudomonadota bacterium]